MTLYEHGQEIQFHSNDYEKMIRALVIAHLSKAMVCGKVF